MSLMHPTPRTRWSPKEFSCSMACWKTATTASSWPVVLDRVQRLWWLIHNWQRLGSTRRFRSRFEKKGLKSLGSQFDLLGPYQATGVFVMRPWAAAHAAALELYFSASIEGQRYVTNPSHRRETVALLADAFKLSREAALGHVRSTAQAKRGLGARCTF